MQREVPQVLASSGKSQQPSSPLFFLIPKKHTEASAGRHRAGERGRVPENDTLQGGVKAEEEEEEEEEGARKKKNPRVSFSVYRRDIRVTPGAQVRSTRRSSSSSSGLRDPPRNLAD